MTKGKVVLVPFPFDDLSSAKVRPAICLCNPIGPHRHVVLAFVTSQVPDRPLDSDLLLPLQTSLATGMGLRVDSALRLHRLITLSSSVIRRELGRVPPDIQAQIDRRLRALFDLD